MVSYVAQLSYVWVHEQSKNEVSLMWVSAITKLSLERPDVPRHVPMATSWDSVRLGRESRAPKTRGWLGRPDHQQHTNEVSLLTSKVGCSDRSLQPVSSETGNLIRSIG